MAGIIGIIKSWGIIKSAVGLAAKEMGGKSNVEASVKRTQRDISMKIIAIGSIITLLLVVLFFYFDVMQGNLQVSLSCSPPWQPMPLRLWAQTPYPE